MVETFIARQVEIRLFAKVTVLVNSEFVAGDGMEELGVFGQIFPLADIQRSGGYFRQHCFPFPVIRGDARGGAAMDILHEHHFFELVPPPPPPPAHLTVIVCKNKVWLV